MKRTMNQPPRKREGAISVIRVPTSQTRAADIWHLYSPANGLVRRYRMRPSLNLKNVQANRGFDESLRGHYQCPQTPPTEASGWAPSG